MILDEGFYFRHDENRNENFNVITNLKIEFVSRLQNKQNDKIKINSSNTLNERKK